LIILGHIFTFKHLCLHSITKILRNGPKAHFPFTRSLFAHDLFCALSLSLGLIYISNANPACSCA
jgi:hypothetical protein